MTNEQIVGLAMLAIMGLVLAIAMVTDGEDE